MIEKFINLHKFIQIAIFIILFIIGLITSVSKGLAISLIPFSLFIFLKFKLDGKKAIAEGAFFVIIYFSMYSLFAGLDDHYRMPDADVFIVTASWIILGLFFIFMKVGSFFGSTGSILQKDYMFSIDDISSYPNEEEQEAGYKFSTLKDLKTFDSGIKIDNFSYYPLVEKYVLQKKYLEEAKEVSIRISPLNFTKTFLVLGAMGSGKTEFFHSILNQNKFSRNIIHDIKGDFVEKWYNPEKDFIFNPYDTRGVNWDLWEELKQTPALVESFISNLMESQTEEKDFFTASAKKVIIDFFMKINYQYTDKSSAEKWDYLNKEIETYKEESESNKTKGSIYQTMDLVIELFSYMAWHSQQGKKSFTIDEFLQGNGTLYLLNNSSVATKLTPLFTGFISLFTEILLSQPDTKENLILILLDEYLSMNFEKQTRLKLLTQVRSKGGCLMLGMQYLPKQDIEHQQLLDSSAYGKLIFQISDNETVNHIIENISDITYVSTSTGTSSNSSGFNGGLIPGSTSGASTNKSENTRKLLSSEHLQSMPAYSHLSIFASEKVLYLGYTDMVKGLVAKNNHFEPINQNDYYKSKYNSSSPKNISIPIDTSKDEGKLKDIEKEIKQLEEELQAEK